MPRRRPPSIAPCTLVTWRFAAALASVTTSSGVGNSQKGFHPIQEALAEHSGGQCGFCSPGLVTSCFGMLASSKGEKCPVALKVESCIDWYVRRCTGYRLTLEAFKTFAGADKASVAGEKFAPFRDFLKERGADAGMRTYAADGRPGSRVVHWTTW